MKKTKVLTIAAVGLGLTVVPAHALFVPDLNTAVLYSILGQLTQEVAKAGLILRAITDTKAEIAQYANYVRLPQTWKSYLNVATSVTGTSNGADAIELQRYNAMLRTAHESYNQFSFTELNAGDMARMDQLGIQMVDLQQKADALSASLLSSAEYQAKVRNDDGWGCVSCTLGAHQR
jgi:hypothetical protein